MKQIFDWLREQMQTHSNEAEASMFYMIDEGRGERCVYSEIDFEEQKSKTWIDAISLVDEAEAKWEADCCELLDKLIAETPQYRHGVCAFRNEEECVSFEHCENCLVDAVKDIIKNSDSRFRKISEVE